MRVCSDALGSLSPEALSPCGIPAKGFEAAATDSFGEGLAPEFDDWAHAMVQNANKEKSRNLLMESSQRGMLAPIGRAGSGFGTSDHRPVAGLACERSRRSN